MTNEHAELSDHLKSGKANHSSQTKPAGYFFFLTLDPDRVNEVSTDKRLRYEGLKAAPYV